MCIFAFSYSLSSLYPFPLKSKKTTNQNFPNTIFAKNMKSRTISLTISIGIAIMAILASKALFDTHPRAFMHNVLHTIKAISYSAITSVYSHHHHHHHHHHRKPSDTKKKVDICDDFPKNIPPPDTDTTSYLCVDKKGCCNFTTVQSAVDAIGNFSQKRNVIWINSGMY